MAKKLKAGEAVEPEAVAANEAAEAPKAKKVSEVSVFEVNEDGVPKLVRVYGAEQVATNAGKSARELAEGFASKKVKGWAKLADGRLAAWYEVGE